MTDISHKPTGSFPPDIIIPINKIRVPHEVMDQAKVDAIARDMRAVGRWDGRPIVAIELLDGTYQSWTGSHRIPAAKAAGLSEIPAVLVDRDWLHRIGFSYDEATRGWEGADRFKKMLAEADLKTREMMQFEWDLQRKIHR